jgi:hypothetical protein
MSQENMVSLVHDCPKTIDIDGKDFEIVPLSITSRTSKYSLSMLHELCDYSSSDVALRHYYKMIQGPHYLLQRAIDVLRAALGHVIPLVSMKTQTLLRFKYDLDVDWIVPRNIVRPENVFHLIQGKNHKEDNKWIILDEYKELIQSLGTILGRKLESYNFQIKDYDLITRSIQFTMIVDEIQIEGDRDWSL